MPSSSYFNLLPKVIVLLVGSFGLVTADKAKAVQFELGSNNEVIGNFDVTLGYAASMRTSDAAEESLNPNNSVLTEGTAPNILSHLRVPDAGDLISSVFKGTAELGVQWRNLGFVGSVTYQYDTEIMNGDSVDFIGNSAPWSDAAEDYAGNYWEVLDAYIYGSFDLVENPLDVRLGKQVINWGEGLYFIDGISIQTPLNYNKLVTPGSELKEAYIGLNSLYVQMGLGDNVSISAYIQNEWHRAEFGPRGTFYGDDILFRGGTEIDPLLGVPIRDKDDTPDDDGQWGIASRFFVTEDVEMGIYYSNYHETVPFLQLTTPGSEYDLGSATSLQQYWPEDVELYGLSLATTLGAWSFNGELATRY